MPQIQFAAQSYQARSAQLLAQQCINAFVETAPEGSKSKVPIYGTPGLTIFARVGGGPVNGMWVMGDLLYVLSGGVLYSVTPQGVVVLIGQTNLGGICSMADNGQQLVMVDGSGGWVYQPTGLNQVTTVTADPITTITATVAGGITAGDVVSLMAVSNGISGAPVTVSYTVLSTDTATSTAAGLAQQLNANDVFYVAGVVATPSGASVSIQWSATLLVSWQATSGTTDTLTMGSAVTTGANSIPANITGTINAGDTLSIPLDNGVTFTTTAAATATAASTSIELTDTLPSQVSAGALIIDATTTLGQILTPAFLPANTVAYMDGYFVFNAAGTRQFFLSGINDGTQYSGLDFATATANTGFVQAVVNFHEQLLIFTSKQSTEVWYDSGAAAFPFQRYDGVYIQRGISNPLAQTNEDNTTFWVGDDGIAYRLTGFVPERISTFAMEHAWAQYPLKFTDCTMFVLDQEGHKFVVCQFWSGNTTWVYDISTKLWHQRESWPSSGTGPWIPGPPAPPAPPLGSPQIAQLVIPSDSYGTPTSAVVDWARGKIYLLSSTSNSARVYSAELVTQNPILSANFPLAALGSGNGAVDPTNGNLIVPTSIYANTQQLVSIDPSTMALIATYGALSVFPSYPASIDAVNALICVACGTAASGGAAQVGYAFGNQYGYTLGWAAVRTDNMTAAGFADIIIANTACCAGKSGSTGGSVFLANASGSASITLSAINVAPGAETYSIASWPTRNPYITSSTIGAIAATAVDSTATTISCSNMGYDSIDGLVILDATTNGTGAVTRFMIGVSPANAAVIWVAPLSGGSNNLALSRISSAMVEFLKSGTGFVVNTSNGSVVGSTLNGVAATSGSGSGSLNLVISDDVSKLVLLECAYTEEAGSPTPVSGTPANFTGWAVAGLWGSPWT